MCGIVGYIGQLDAKEILLKGLEKLEYRYHICINDFAKIGNPSFFFKHVYAVFVRYSDSS